MLRTDLHAEKISLEKGLYRDQIYGKESGEEDLATVPERNDEILN